MGTYIAASVLTILAILIGFGMGRSTRDDEE